MQYAAQLPVSDAEPLHSSRADVLALLLACCTSVERGDAVEWLVRNGHGVDVQAAAKVLRYARLPLWDKRVTLLACRVDGEAVATWLSSEGDAASCEALLPLCPRADLAALDGDGRGVMARLGDRGPDFVAAALAVAAAAGAVTLAPLSPEAKFSLLEVGWDSRVASPPPH